MRLQHRIQPGFEIQLVAGEYRPVKQNLLVAVDDPGQVDPDVELFEDLQLHLTARHGDEGQRRDDVGIAGGLRCLLAEVQRVIGLDRFGVLADFLAADQKIVVVPIVGPDDVAGK